MQTQIGAISQNGKYQLQIIAQPEQQHRARWVVEIHAKSSTTSRGERNENFLIEIAIFSLRWWKYRYQTEGSRGAVKDRSGNGFPVVKLVGYDRPANLQIFIGTDVGRTAPHMFYQACKVSGKNSTACNENKVEGTIVIEIDLKPEHEMTVTCDCVGILKVSV